MIPKQIIIWGGGESINIGLSLGLKEKLKDKFVLGTNFSFNHFIPTALCFADNPFYQGIFYNNAPDLIDANHIAKLEKLPLLIGIERTLKQKDVFPNTILLKKSNFFVDDPLKDGFKFTLTGIFALQLAGVLTDWDSEIYCLGFDWTKQGETHYYKDIQHRGIGKTSWYKTNDPSYSFEYFTKKPNFKVYNVSLNSNIETFPKISYNQMFEMLDNEVYNQDLLRKEIKLKLK
jgi:hypothetical protein